METVETLNNRLKEYFGKDDRDMAIWRIVWSDDELEKQLLFFSPEGVELINPEWFIVPKYKMIGIHSRYILERLVVVPFQHLNQVTTKTSYEPIWTFEDKNSNPLPPKWEACQLIINTVYAAQGKKTNEPLYHDAESGLVTKDLIQYHKDRVENLKKELFGNETDTGDALAYREGVTVPFNYEKN